MHALGLLECVVSLFHLPQDTDVLGFGLDRSETTEDVAEALCGNPTSR
jgi:hypothetical protein